jgi:hypothetical protein
MEQRCTAPRIGPERASPAGQVMRAASHGWSVWIQGRTLRTGDHRPASALERRLRSVRVSHSIGVPPAPCRAPLPSCMPRWTPRRRPPEPLPAQYITPKRTRALQRREWLHAPGEGRASAPPRCRARHATAAVVGHPTRSCAGCPASRRAGEQPARGQHGGEPHTRQRGRRRALGCRRRSSTSPSQPAGQPASQPASAHGQRPRLCASAGAPRLWSQRGTATVPCAARRCAASRPPRQHSVHPAVRHLQTRCFWSAVVARAPALLQPVCAAASPARQHHTHHAALGVWPPTQRPASRGPVLARQQQRRPCSATKAAASSSLDRTTTCTSRCIKSVSARCPECSNDC